MTEVYTAGADSCPVHGLIRQRATCRACNAAYMRIYLRRRRRANPIAALLERARSRARRRGVPFGLKRHHIDIPSSCPALGIALELCQERSDHSPSLDRIEPSKGYVPGNVRVISDRANRLKGDRTARELRLLAQTGGNAFRADYALIAAYVEREAYARIAAAVVDQRCLFFLRSVGGEIGQFG